MRSLGDRTLKGARDGDCGMLKFAELPLGLFCLIITALSNAQSAGYEANETENNGNHGTDCVV